MTAAAFFTALFYLGNLLFAVSYAVRDILSLRVLSVTAGLAATPYFLAQEEPLWSAALWQGVYMSINAVHIVKLMLERRPVSMTEEQERIHAQVFSSLRPREFLRLLAMGSERGVAPGEVLIEHGSEVGELNLVLGGELVVELEGGLRAKLEPGHFAGELSLVRGTRARGTVRAEQEVTCISWSHAQLEALERKHPALDNALRAAIGRDMANKVVEDKRQGRDVPPP